MTDCTSNRLDIGAEVLEKSSIGLNASQIHDVTKKWADEHIEYLNRSLWGMRMKAARGIITKAEDPARMFLSHFPLAIFAFNQPF